MSDPEAKLTASERQLLASLRASGNVAEDRESVAAAMQRLSVEGAERRSELLAEFMALPADRFPESRKLLAVIIAGESVRLQALGIGVIDPPEITALIRPRGEAERARKPTLIEFAQAVGGGKMPDWQKQVFDALVAYHDSERDLVRRKPKPRDEDVAALAEAFEVPEDQLREAAGLPPKEKKP